MARKSLDDILDGNDEPEVIEEPQAEVSEPEEQPEAQPRDESGKFVSKGEPEPEGEPQEEPPSSESDEANGLLAAKQAEKARRKAAEDETRRLSEQLEALRNEIKANQQPKEPEAPPPSIWEDDEGWQQHFGGQIVNQATAQAAYQNKLNTSEFYARKNIEGFEDEWEPLNKWLQENPNVAQQAASDYDPWGYAYRAYSNQKTMSELGATDMASLKAKMREELLAELAAEKPVAPPPSLSTKRSVASRSGPAWSGPKPLNELLDN